MERRQARFTYLGHRELALESAPDPIVNTLGFPPCLLDTLIAIRLVTPGGLGVSRSNLHG